ncbi:hypothetical protein FF2_028659 [Malus domestica]
MEAGDDWRTQLQSESRHRIVAKIIETMKRHIPFDGPEGLRKIERIAVTFEENMYVGASSQSDYLRKISLKMLTMETKSQTAVSHASLDPVLMDTNIQTRPPQGGEPPMEAGVDWRSQLQSESRHRIVAKIIETMVRHIPFDGPEGLRELERIAVTFEEEIYVSEEGSYKLIRFLVEMLSDSSEVGGKAGPEGVNDERKEKEGSSGSNLEDQTTGDEEPDLSCDKSEVPEISVDVCTSSTGGFNKDRQNNVFSENHSTEKVQNQEQLLMEEVKAKTSELEEELELVKEAADMAFDVHHSVEFHLEKLNEQEEELSKLSTDLEKQPKVASRKSYIEGVKEITKNSRKQEADIQQILKDTRELQLESNSIQERLHRTYAVVDEMVFREAKKDAVGKQAYRLLTSIHESFEQIREKIMATDRIRREVGEHEKKLVAMASRRLNVDKLQADLDAIRRENDY